MSQASDLLHRGQQFHAAQFPATISIAGQPYEAATSGEKREPDLLNGGWLKKVSISFWLPLSAFGGTPPADRSSVTCGAKTYTLAVTKTDPAKQTIILECESQHS